MKTPKEFAYDLWTTEDGKYMVRVKSTGEVTEVDRAVMRALRLEEKHLRRHYAHKEFEDTSDLSLDYISYPTESLDATWLVDLSQNLEAAYISHLNYMDFKKSLTPRQFSILQECLIEGKNLTEYAIETGITRQAVHESILLIRKKFEKFFGDT